MRKFLFVIAAALSVGAVALPASAAITPTAPAAVTGTASIVTERGAILTGTVTANGAPTTYSFQYGLTTSYGSSTPLRVIRNGAETARTVEATIGGLTAGTPYHFRLVATNSAGTTDGSDQTFTTVASAAPAVTTGSALNISKTSASVDGTISPEGSATTYYFQYGTTTSYGSQTVSRTTGPGQATRPVIAFLGGLTPNTPYHFRLVATNASGTTDGTDATFTTLAAPVATAPVVTTGSALRVREGSAVVDGTLSPQGAASTYYFEYGTTTAYGSQTPSHTTGPRWGTRPVIASINGLTPNTPYHFRLVATNSVGTTDGTDATFTTLAAPVGAAPVVTTGSALRVREGSAVVDGTLSPQGAASTYYFEYGTTTAYGSQTPSHTTGPRWGTRPVIASISGLTPNTPYHFRLVATNSVGTTDGTDATFTTLASTTPPQREWFAGSVSAVGSNSLTVGVLWTGPHDGALNGQTVTVSVPSTGVVILKGVGRGRRHPIPLSQIQDNDLVALTATGSSSSDLTATKIVDYCNCHFVSGTIGTTTSTPSDSFTVRVTSTGPYDTVLQGQTVTMQTSSSTIYLQGRGGWRRINPISFASLTPGEHVAVIFAADGFFKAPGFNPATATFTASRVAAWGRGTVPIPMNSVGLQGAAQTSVSG